MPGLPLSLPEREEISVALIEDRAMAWAVIARRVRRHPSTIAREVTAHGGREGYRPAVAHAAAVTALGRVRESRLAQAGLVRDRVAAELAQGRSPYAIWADMAAEHLEGRPCVETIYRAVYDGSLGVKPGFRS